MPNSPKSNRFDGARLEQLILDHREDLELWAYGNKLGMGLTKPRFPEALGDEFLKLARVVASNAKWKGQAWTEDATGDALLRCMQVWDRWDPEKGAAFSYFYSIAYRRFLSHIESEQRHPRIRRAYAAAHGVPLERATYHEDEAA